MRCTLYGFITDYVKDIFVEEIYFDIREKLKEVTQGTKIYCMSLPPSRLGSKIFFYPKRLKGPESEVGLCFSYQCSSDMCLI